MAGVGCRVQRRLSIGIRLIGNAVWYGGAMSELWNEPAVLLDTAAAGLVVALAIRSLWRTATGSPGCAGCPQPTTTRQGGEPTKNVVAVGQLSLSRRRSDTMQSM